MFTANFKYQYCSHSFSSHNAYAQHVNLYIVKYDISTEEFNNSNDFNNEISEMISEVTDMVVDSENNENSEYSEYSKNSEDSVNSERQEEMTSSFKMRENSQDLQKYNGDVSLISLSISKRYENLPSSLQSFEESKIKN
ncbi:2451_t:CDS:1, partial [Diversispora eburnea]